MGAPEIIDLSSSSDEYLLGAESGLEAEFQLYNQFDEDHSGTLDGTSLAYDQALRHQLEGHPRRDTYELCLKDITEIFPDICHDHVKNLFDRQLHLENGGEAVEVLIEHIISSGNYPKERDRLRKLNELKRKRADQTSDDEEAARWKYDDLKHSPLEYAKVSKTVLQEAFPRVPARYIEEVFKHYGHFYGAYLAIAKAERQYGADKDNPYMMLKSRRHNGGLNSEGLMLRLKLEGHDFDDLKKEIEAARQRREKDDRKQEKEAKEAAEAEAKDQEFRERGEVIECACCFDEVPISKITHCNGETPHFFCYGCARMNASNDIGVNKYGLQCMDGSVCKATFSRAERAKFLDKKIIEKLENLEQQDAIRLAAEHLQDFENCPYCDYGHICPPVEMDKEFRCEYPECQEISCRLCKQKSHIPMSCDEYKKENGVSERRAIEEARTEALIRTCPKCSVRILKEDGCNKVVCTTCYSVICDYCGKDISKVKYNHFDGQAHVPRGMDQGGEKCPLYDPSNDRKDKQIEEAGKTAMDRVRRDNPQLSEDDLKIKFSKEVEAMKSSDGQPNVPRPQIRFHQGPNVAHPPPLRVIPNAPIRPVRLQRYDVLGRFEAEHRNAENARVFEHHQQHSNARITLLREQMGREGRLAETEAEIGYIQRQQQAHLEAMRIQIQTQQEAFHAHQEGFQRRLQGRMEAVRNTPLPPFPQQGQQGDRTGNRNSNILRSNEIRSRSEAFEHDGSQERFDGQQFLHGRQAFANRNIIPLEPRHSSPDRQRPVRRQRHNRRDSPPENLLRDPGPAPTLELTQQPDQGVGMFLDGLWPGSLNNITTNGRPQDAMVREGHRRI